MKKEKKKGILSSTIRWTKRKACSTWKKGILNKLYFAVFLHYKFFLHSFERSFMLISTHPSPSSINKTLPLL